jgi:hypothetical protein
VIYKETDAFDKSIEYYKAAIMYGPKNVMMTTYNILL